jgi:acetyltransferase-like isoleucine patch superfamily enzyme
MSASSHFNHKDIWGVWAIRLARWRNRLLEMLWSFYVKLKCLYWKITLGKGCRFWGNMHFQRIAGSSITVGEECRFRSATWSNLIGTNRPCYLCTLRPNAKIIIGKGSGFSGTVISAAQSIEIGPNVICGANVTITDTDWHNLDRSLDGMRPAATAPVTIGENVWLAMNVTVLKGVSIGENSVVAANSIVTRDIPANVLAAGQPAKIIKKISTVL